MFKKGKVVIFTGSYSKTLENLREHYGVRIFYDLVDRIDKILEFQRMMKENGGKLNHILIVFDDVIVE